MPTDPTPVPELRFKMRCQECNAVLRASRKLMGAVCTCPNCKAKVVVRVPLPSDSDIHLVIDDRPTGLR